MTDGKVKAAEPSLFQGLACSPAREATRRATRRFCKLLQPAHERENRPVYLDTRRVRSKPSRHTHTECGLTFHGVLSGRLGTVVSGGGGGVAARGWLGPAHCDG